MELVFDVQMLYLGLGLLGLILINILLGSINAFIERKFDQEKFMRGVIKGAIITVSFVGVYLIGHVLVPDIAINIAGQELTLDMAVHVIVVSGFVIYGKQVLEKLASFIKVEL